MPAIAKAVGLDFSGPPGPSAQLINYPHNRSILLWLGNLEHLLDGIEWLTGMLASLPGLKLHLPIGARAAAGDRVGVGAKVHAVLSQCVERAGVLGDLEVLRFALRYEGRVHTLRGRVKDALLHLRRVVRDRHGMIVHDANDAVVIVQHGGPVFDGTRIVADVDGAAGLDAAKDLGFSGHS